ncbi:MAG: hypothetical protein V1701_01100 [Planctomycetota bacterium]
MKLFAFILSVFLPGLGQVLLERYRRGIIIFFSYIILLDLVFVILPCLYGISTELKNILLFVSAGIYIYNLYNITWIIFLRELDSFLDKKKNLFKNCILLYLKNDIGNALSQTTKLFHIDPDDANSTFYLAMIYNSLNNPAKAKKLIIRCSILSDKWQRIIK